MLNRSCKHNSFPCDKSTTKPFQGNDADIKSCHFCQWRIQVFWWEKLPKTTEITSHLHYLNKYEHWEHLLYPSGWEGNESRALFSILPRKRSDTMICFFGIVHIPFPLRNGFSVTSVPGHKQQGHNPVEDFTASSMSIRPHQCPFLTVLLWSFSALLFWSMYAGCSRQVTVRGFKPGEPKTSSHLDCYYRHIVYPNITSLPLQRNNLILVLLPGGFLVDFCLSSAYADMCFLIQ